MNGKSGNNTPHVVFQFQNIPVDRRMEATLINTNGYSGSEIRKYLVPTGDNNSGQFLTGLVAAGVPQNILWAPKRFVADSGYPTQAVLVQDLLWIPTEWEMSGMKIHASDVENVNNQGVLEYYADDSKRIKFNGENQPYKYSTASPYKGGTTSFCAVKTNGADSYVSGDNSILPGSGCAPAFCIQ